MVAGLRQSLRIAGSAATPSECRGTTYATHMGCRTRALRHTGHVAAIHQSCRTMALRHPHRAASGSLSAQYGAESGPNRHRAGQLWRSACQNWHCFFWLYYRYNP